MTSLIREDPGWGIVFEFGSVFVESESGPRGVPARCSLWEEHRTSRRMAGGALMCFTGVSRRTMCPALRKQVLFLRRRYWLRISL